MKNRLLPLILLTFQFLSCNKNEDPPLPPEPDTSAYEGTWSGSFYGDHEGPWTMTVTDHGTASQSFVGLSGTGVGSGTVTEDGLLNMNFSTGAESTGQFNAETEVVNGFWSINNPGSSLSGSFFGTKD